MGRILRTFLAGVLALLPIAVTVFVIAWVASLIAGYAGPGSFIGRLITTLGTSLGLNIEPSSTAAYLLGLPSSSAPSSCSASSSSRGSGRSSWTASTG